MNAGLPAFLGFGSVALFFDFDEGPKLAIVDGDPLPGSGDVYVDDGLLGYPKTSPTTMGLYKYKKDAKITAQLRTT